MEATNHSHEAGPSYVSRAATKNGPAGDIRENTIAKTVSSSTCNRVNVKKVSIKWFHRKKSYHVTSAKPKIKVA